MIVFAVAVTNDAYGRFLLGSNPKDLSWGPTLFRILLIMHGGLLAAIAILPKRQTEIRRKPTDKGERNKISVSMVPALAALGIVALVLRLWNLNSDLWIDEVLTLLDFVRQPAGEIVTSFPSQNQHMLFSLLAHGSTNLFGESAWSLRLPSVVFGVISIWAFFFLCKRFVDSRAAFLGSVLMTVSYHHIWFSQNARGYMGLLLFTLVATWCWLEALETNEWKWWLSYSAAIVLGMWVHATMAFVVAAHGITYLALYLWPRLAGATPGSSLERKVGMRPFAAWLLSVTVTLQLYALALPEFLAVGLHEESKDSEWTNPLWVVTESLQSLRIGFAGGLVLVCGAAFVLFGWWRLYRTDRRAAVVMVLPAVLAGGTMLALGHNIWPRFFFFSMGFGLLILIFGAIEIPRFVADFRAAGKLRGPWVSFAGISFCLLIIIASLVTLPKNYAMPKQNFSEAKNFVEKQRSAEEGVVAVSLAGVVYGSYLEPHWPVATTATELENIENGNERVWLVYTLPIELKAFRPDVWRVIDHEYEIVKVFPGTLNGGEVFVCRRKLN